MIILLRFSHHSIFDQSRQRWTLAKSVAWKDDSLSSIISPKLDRITLQSPKTYAPKGPKVGKQSLRIGIKMTKRWRKRCLTNPWRRTSAFGESEERLEEVLECGKWVSVESDSVSSFSSWIALGIKQGDANASGCFWSLFVLPLLAPSAHSTSPSFSDTGSA